MPERSLEAEHLMVIGLGLKRRFAAIKRYIFLCLNALS